MKHADWLIAAVTIGMLGCSAKKTVQPIRGPAFAQIDYSKCKPHGIIFGEMICNGVVLVPRDLNVKQ